MADQQVQLWTTWCVYGATGEGVTLLARIDHAQDEAQCRRDFAEAFDPFWPCSVEPGVVRNYVTRRLFSPETLDWVASMERSASVQLEGCLHFNLA